jgi:hypothetical protein
MSVLGIAVGGVMTLDVEFDDEKLKEIIARIKKFRRPPRMRQAMRKVVNLVKRDIAKYPSSTAANRPGREVTVLGKTRKLGHYQRGDGWVTVRGKHLGNSETLGKRWTTETTQGGDMGVVGNNASYVRWIHDEEKQARFHEATGWPTVQQVLEDRRVLIRDILMEPMKDLIDGQ